MVNEMYQMCRQLWVDTETTLRKVLFEPEEKDGFTEAYFY